jgi:hypothetical protein
VLEKHRKDTNGKEELNLSLFGNDMILYLKDPKDTMKKILHLINTFNKVAGQKMNIQKSVASLYTNNEQTEKEIKKTILFTIPRNKLT